MLARRVRRGLGREAAERADRRPVHRQEADRVHARAARRAACSRRSRTSAPPGWRRRPPRWRRAAGWASTSTSARVPLREPGMEPFEIMISESQERMAAVVTPDQWAAVEETCRRWEVDATVDRRDHRLRPPALLPRRGAGRRHPGSALTDGCPRYEVERVRPARLRDDPSLQPRRSDPNVALRALLGSVEVGSRAVGVSPVRPPGRLGHRRPARRRRGRRAADAVAARDRRLARRQRPAHLARPAPRRDERGCEAARNVACTGARPAAVTELPQLRKSRDLRRRLRAGRGDRGHGAGVRGARSAGRLGQRLAL